VEGQHYESKQGGEKESIHLRTSMPDRAAKLYPVIPFLRERALTPELEREITRLDLALPCPAELDLVLNGIIESAGLTGHRDLTAGLREATLAAAGGLTTLEAENAFTLQVKN